MPRLYARHSRFPLVSRRILVCRDVLGPAEVSAYRWVDAARRSRGLEQANHPRAAARAGDRSWEVVGGGVVDPGALHGW